MGRRRKQSAVAGQDGNPQQPGAYPNGKSQRLFQKQSFGIPDNWRIPALHTGKTFHLCVYYSTSRTTIQTKDGPKPFSGAFPWAKDAVVRILYDDLKDPARLKDLLENKRNPIMLFGQGEYNEPDYYQGRTRAQVDAYFDFVLKAKQAFGDRFLCFDYGEWSWGGVTDTTNLMKKRCDNIFHIPYPKDRDEGALYSRIVVFNDQMWILGGATYDTPKTPKRTFYNDVWRSPDGAHWKRQVEHAVWGPRQYHDVAVFDGRIWVLEGWTEKRNRNDSDVWHSADGTTWHELPDTPWKPRHAASVFVHADALWMVAGNNMGPDVWKPKRK